MRTRGLFVVVLLAGCARVPADKGEACTTLATVFADNSERCNVSGFNRTEFINGFTAGCCANKGVCAASVPRPDAYFACEDAMRRETCFDATSGSLPDACFGALQ